MKLRRPVVALIAVAAFALTACSGRPPAPRPPSAPPRSRCRSSRPTSRSSRARSRRSGGASWDDAKATSRILTDNVTYLLLDGAARRAGHHRHPGRRRQGHQPGGREQRRGRPEEVRREPRGWPAPRSQIRSPRTGSSSARVEKARAGRDRPVKPCRDQPPKVADDLGVDVARASGGGTPRSPASPTRRTTCRCPPAGSPSARPAAQPSQRTLGDRRAPRTTRVPPPGLSDEAWTPCAADVVRPDDDHPLGVRSRRRTACRCCAPRRGPRRLSDRRRPGATVVWVASADGDPGLAGARVATGDGVPRWSTSSNREDLVKVRGCSTSSP